MSVGSWLRLIEENGFVRGVEKNRGDILRGVAVQYAAFAGIAERIGDGLAQRGKRVSQRLLAQPDKRFFRIAVRSSFGRPAGSASVSERAR